MGLLLPESADERARLSRLLHEGSGPSVRRARLPNRGVRERLYAMAGCHAAPEGKGSLCCDTARIDAVGTGIRYLNACAGSEVALVESRLRGSRASLNSDCQKTG